MRKRGRRRDHRTSKIGGRRKRRAEKREGRKEGRTRASRRSGRRTHRSQAGQARNLSLSPSFSFDPRLRSPRARRSRSSSFSFSPACPPLITLHGPPPEPSVALFSPRTAAHRLLPHPHPAFPTSLPPFRLKPPFSPLLRARPRQTKTNYAAFSEPQRAPTSYTTLARRPFAPPPLSILVYRLPRNSPPTSPNHPHATFLVPAQTTPFPSPSAASETLCYVGHQMGAQPPTHSRRASCPRTTSRLLQLCQPPRILLLPPLALAAAAS